MGITVKVRGGILVIIVVALAYFLTFEGVITMDITYLISGVAIAIFILALMRTRSSLPL